MKQSLLYIHGLGSDRNSRKFLALKEYFKDQFQYDFIEWKNDSNISQLLNEANKKLRNIENFIVVGDSTGANFAYQLREMRNKDGQKAKLILTSPLLNIEDRIADFDFPKNIIQYLWRIENPRNALIIAAPNDEILNQRNLTENNERGLKLIKVEDNHRLENFEHYLPHIEKYINSKI